MGKCPNGRIAKVGRKIAKLGDKPQFRTLRASFSGLPENLSRKTPSTPRRPRITLPEVPLNLIPRGNNRQACFFAAADYHNLSPLTGGVFGGG